MTVIIRNATLADVQGISKLLRDVSLDDDPEFHLMVASKIVTSDELLEYIIQTHTHHSVLNHPCSLVIECEDSGEIIGIRLSEPHHNVSKEPLILKFLERSEGLRKRSQFFKDIYRDSTDNGNVGVSFLQLTIAPDHRQRGLAKQLVKKAISIAVAHEFSFIDVCAASEYTSRIFNKLGFQKLSEINYRTYKQGGKQFFNPLLVNVHSSMILYRLLLDDID